MINTPTLRKLGADGGNYPNAVLAEACLQAADTIDELCGQIDGCVRIAADALKRLKEKELATNP